MTRRYAMAFFAAAILMLIVLVGYGIYVNATSSAHVKKMSAAQFYRVKGAIVAFRDITPTIYLPVANVYSSQTSDVHFPIDGTITRLHVKAGDKIQAGQLMCEVINEELTAQILQAEGKVSSAEALMVKWDGTVKRYRKLMEMNSISRQQMDEAVGNLKASEGEYAAACAFRNQLAARRGSGQMLAPHSGDLLRIYYSPGSTVRTGDSLAMIGDLSSLFIRHNTPDVLLDQLKPLTGTMKLSVKSNESSEKTYFSSAATGNFTGGKDFDVEISEVSPALNIPADYRSVVYRINNPAKLIEPGTYHQVKIYHPRTRNVLAVPIAALQGNTDPRVYVSGADNCLELRKVQTGIRDDTFVEVRNGLREDETVIVSGKDDELLSGMKVQVTLESPKTP